MDSDPSKNVEPTELVLDLDAMDASLAAAKLDINVVIGDCPKDAVGLKRLWRQRSILMERVRVLEQELEAARAWVRRLTANERVLTCVFCGQAYPPGTRTHGADVLTAHIRACEKHPLRKAEAVAAEAIAHLRAWQRQAGSSHSLAGSVNDALRALGAEP